MGDLIFQELDEVGGDGAGCVVLGGVWLRLIRVVGLDDCDDAVWVDGDVMRADAVFWGHDEVWFAVGREIRHSDVVEAFEGGGGGVDFDDDLGCELDLIPRIQRTYHIGGDKPYQPSE